MNSDSNHIIVYKMIMMMMTVGSHTNCMLERTNGRANGGHPGPYSSFLFVTHRSVTRRAKSTSVSVCTSDVTICTH